LFGFQFSTLGVGFFQLSEKISTVGVQFFQLLVNFPLWVSGIFPNFWFSKALLFPVEISLHPVGNQLNLGSSSKAWLGKE